MQYLRSCLSAMGLPQLLGEVAEAQEKARGRNAVLACFERIRTAVAAAAAAGPGVGGAAAAGGADAK